jgi:hypothetical protein
VRIPKAATAMQVLDPNDDTILDIDDPRALGPVYIGVYPSVQDNLFNYLHPEMGPVFDPAIPGDTYPYGGTTVGRFQYGCYQQLICRTVTGRYTSYDDILDFFSNTLHRPVQDIDGHTVGGGTEFQEHCFDAFEITADWELDLVSDDVDFRVEGDYYVADVDILHTQYHEGMQVWGWVDMPSAEFKFASCTDGQGDYYAQYADQYYLGTNADQLLNYPSNFIGDGDWVAGTSDGDPFAAIPTINSPDSGFELTLGFQNKD